MSPNCILNHEPLSPFVETLIIRKTFLFSRRKGIKIKEKLAVGSLGSDCLELKKETAFVPTGLAQKAKIVDNNW